MSIDSQTPLHIVKLKLTTSLQVGETGDNRTHELSFLLSSLELRQPLHDGDAPTATGQQHRPTSFVGVTNHLARVDLQVTERHYIL
jgi:hypothetical protein